MNIGELAQSAQPAKHTLVLDSWLPVPPAQPLELFPIGVQPDDAIQNARMVRANASLLHVSQDSFLGFVQLHLASRLGNKKARRSGFVFVRHLS